MSTSDRCRRWQKPPDENGCIKSRYALDKDGYAPMKVGQHMSKHHIVAWALANKKWPPEGLEVMHKECNSRDCTNPDHLELGTHAQNRADSAKAGLARTGPHLTPERRAALEDDIRAGLSIKQLLEKHDVTPPTISRARKRMSQ